MEQNIIPYKDLPDVLNARQLAVVLNISRAGAYNLLNNKNFPTLRVGGRVLVPKKQLIEWIEESVMKNKSA